MCAYILQPGLTVVDVVTEAGMTHLWPQFVENKDDGTTFPVDHALLFLGDCDPVEVEDATFVRSPQSVFHTSTSGDCWLRLPVTYVSTTKDYSVPHVYQQNMLKHMVEEEMVAVRLVEVETAHSVFISEQEAMLNLVDEVALDTRNP